MVFANCNWPNITFETSIFKTRAKFPVMKQQSLFADKILNEFGGSLLKKGKRKSARPLNIKAPIHLVLKAEDSIQMFRHDKLIRGQINRLCFKFGIKVYSIAVHEDHVHCVIKLSSRRFYRAWIRSLTGILTRRINGLKWRLRPYTKIMKWGKQFKNALAYLKFSNDEALFIKHAWDRLEQFEREMKEFALTQELIGFKIFRHHWQEPQSPS